MYRNDIVEELLRENKFTRFYKTHNKYFKYAYKK